MELVTSNKRRLESSPLSVASLQDAESLRNSKIIKDSPNKVIDKENVESTNLMEIDEWFLDDFPEEAFITDESLDLSSWKRCTVVAISNNTKKFTITLDVKEVHSNKVAQCQLSGPWAHVKINIDDVLSIQAVFDQNLGIYSINSENGLLVTHPDHLISGTTVVGALFCRRKGILSEKFRGLGLGENSIMAMGSIVHEIFQKVLRQKVHTMESVKRVSETILNSPEILSIMFANQMQLADVRKEVAPFLSNIVEFVQQYCTKYLQLRRLHSDKNSLVDIESIEDIEENIWCPQLGIKGKVDVTVSVTKDNQLKRIPLELKTGRASFSMEHRGQLILYELMMKEICSVEANSDSGYLLYLKENTMKEIKGTWNEKRDLIILRNELAQYLIESPLNPLNNNLGTRPIALLRLPEPINHHSACKSCEYNTVCYTYLKESNELENMSKSHPLVSLNLTEHLKQTHIDYFVKWTGLLLLEDAENRKNNQIKLLWTMEPQMRDKIGRAVTNLTILNVTESQDGIFLHKFNKSGVDLSKLSFKEGEYTVVSTNKLIALASGRIAQITPSFISIYLERDLSAKGSIGSFTLDKYESQSINSFNMANLGTLLENNGASDRLRRLIIDLEPPTFLQNPPQLITTTGLSILNKLNVVQRKAALNAIMAKDYMLLKGLPGSGKTHTVVAIIRLLHLLGKSVLITSHTHSAVDNVLQKLLKYELAFMKLGSAERTMESLRDYTESALTANCTNVHELNVLYAKFNIIGVTCLGANHPLLFRKMFDVCLVDESTQVMQPTVLRPLMAAKSFILIGDPDQLPPIVKVPSEYRADVSLFEKLDAASTQATSVLTLQYRMNRTITKLANHLTYKGDLKCAENNIANAKLTLLNVPSVQAIMDKEKWMAKALSTHIDLAVCFLDTGDVAEKTTQCAAEKALNCAANSIANKSNKNIYTNYCEAAIVMHLVKTLLSAGVSGNNIGLMAPYRTQIDLLKKCTQILDEENAHSIEVNTIDQFQGRDKEIVIFCGTATGKNAESKQTEILNDTRRLNVAITRSKHKLIIVGDMKTLLKYSPFAKLLSGINKMNQVILENGKLGFHWDPLMHDLNTLI